MTRRDLLDKCIQFVLPVTAMAGWLATSLKHPEYGLIFAFFAQLFWLHVTYRGWKKASQVGGFVTTIFEILIISFGVLNYWIFVN